MDLERDNSLNGGDESPRQPEIKQTEQSRYHTGGNPEPHKPHNNGNGLAICSIILSIILIGVIGFQTVYYNSALENISSVYSSALGDINRTLAGDDKNSETVLKLNYGLTPNDIYNENVDSVVEISADVVQSSFWGNINGTSSGTGFIIEEDGYIMTNNHVVEDSNNIVVTLHDGTKYTAELVGSNADHDLAILKIDATGLQKVTLGDSDSLAVGDMVYTIGHPLSLPYSMSDGIVSSTNRLITTSANTPLYVIQINSSLNEGNSGGPIFNAKGEVVGIANAKLAGDTIEGIGFAIPIDNAISDFAQIKEFGKVTNKAGLGVKVATVDAQIAETFDMKEGAYVNSVTPDGAADKAGITKGDIIIKVDDTNISNTYDLLAILMNYNVDDKIDVVIWRNGKEEAISVVLQTKVDVPDTESVETPSDVPGSDTQDDIGIDESPEDSMPNYSQSFPNKLPFLN